jgi:VWFA-related protein
VRNTKILVLLVFFVVDNSWSESHQIMWHRFVGLISAIGLACPVLVVALGLQQQRFVERVDVARILIDVRVVDDFGRPVLDLTANDFEVEIDSKPVRVESADWIDGKASQDVPLASTELSGVAAAAAAGRSIVFLVQKSHEPSRAMGLLRWPQVNEPLLAGLTSDDRVAVVSFDFHLKMWLDFTHDIARARTIMARDVMLRDPPSIDPGPQPSLLAQLSRDEGRRTYTIEKALQLLANALAQLPGSKTIVLVGYGFGRMSSQGGAFLMPEYEMARDALQAARVTLLCLDVTFADYHTLELGLQAVAADTGGIFERLYLNPRQAVDRVVNALVGHYVLFAEKPDARPGLHRIAVRLPRAKGIVLARSSYVD